jgi:GNAT superfamily N-acetyltransferase
MDTNSLDLELLVRRAQQGDAAEICNVVRNSIIELCLEDHKGDAEILSRWLETKTAENVLRWLASPANINLVATRRETILAAGCVTLSGEVVLDYVSPTARFQGATSALLAEMEAVTKHAGGDVCFLNSTITARRFYQNRGYIERASPVSKFGLKTWPMIKRL